MKILFTFRICSCFFLKLKKKEGKKNDFFKIVLWLRRCLTLGDEGSFKNSAKKLQVRNYRQQKYVVSLFSKLIWIFQNELQNNYELHPDTVLACFSLPFIRCENVMCHNCCLLFFWTFIEIRKIYTLLRKCIPFYFVLQI